ncbi:MAG: zinc metallopeptidase [Acidobacteriota bacterium]
MFFDPNYLILVGPAIVLSIWASIKTKSAFNKYSKVRVMSGQTGAQAAKSLLQGAGIGDVEIKPIRGNLSDHYNPLTKTLALSEAVYGSPSIAAVGVACHEAGHAIQHAQAYKPLWLRSVLVKPTQFASRFAIWGVMLGLILQMNGLFQVGVILFSVTLVFQLVTLPVEFDASNRAKKLALAQGIVVEQERTGMDKVLNAAALTYVAAAAMSLMQLIYFLGLRRD